MNYEKFIERIKMGVQEELGDEVTTRMQQVLKNNDIKLDGLVIKYGSCEVAPTIYLNEYYEEFKLGKEIHKIVREICEVYMASRQGFAFDLTEFSEFHKAKKKIVFRLVNWKLNQQMLKDIPHEKVLDLAIVYYYLVDTKEQGMASALIHNTHLKMWKVTKEELMLIAVENTERLLKPQLHHILDVIDRLQFSALCGANGYVRETCQYQDMLDEFMDELQKREMYVDAPMFVLTNSKWTNGAACLLYTGLLDKVASCLECDLYVIPSSIHEVILMPMNGKMQVDEVNAMIRQVNQDEIRPGEILSEHVYIYRRKDGQITL